MYIHPSHHAVGLLESLFEVLTEPLPHPLTPEVLMVQSHGMATWLSTEFARRRGVSSNTQYLFPRTFIDGVIDSVFGQLDIARATNVYTYTAHQLFWSIHGLLPSLQEQPGFESVKRYLSDACDGAKRLLFAEHLSGLFGDYGIYRPDWLQAWEEGHETHWQARLWRALVARHGERHFANDVGRLRQLWSTHGVGVELPHRLCIWGLSTMPPIYLEVLELISSRVPVHFFVLTPEPAAFSTARARGGLLGGGLGAEAAAGVLPEGSEPLGDFLRSLNRVGDEFQLLLAERSACAWKGSGHADTDEATALDGEGEERCVFDVGSSATALRALQIALLRSNRGGGEAGPGTELAPNDDSISIHACHSRMREVEVLRDQLLTLLDEDSTLNPRDVLVMAPEIEAYAPFIDAVFGVGLDRVDRIAYRVSDRNERQNSPFIDGYLALLGILVGRFKASEVLDLLERPLVAGQFGIVPGDLGVVRSWVVDAGICWGVDAQHRKEFNQPERDEATWRNGLTRLFLGYAMPASSLYQGHLPCDGLQHEDFECLGRLSEFCERLFLLREKFRHSRTINTWQEDALRAAREFLLSSDEHLAGHQNLERILSRLAESAAIAQFEGEISLKDLSYLLEKELSQERAFSDFLAEGVTFCSMLPMRSIPSKVVCLLGMNDQDFPRQASRSDLNRIIEDPRPGDRRPREEDRQLFLEALLSAQEHLSISYIGRDVQDNRERYPSVVVTELHEALVRGFPVCEWAIHEHPLQPFSPRSFDRAAHEREGGSRRPTVPWSYHALFGRGARAMAQKDHRRKAFQEQPLAEPLVESASLRHAGRAEAHSLLAITPSQARVPLIDLGDLLAFFTAPTRGLLRGRLGVNFTEADQALRDREPIELDPLERYALGDTCLALCLEGAGVESTWARIQASPMAPLGTPGRVTIRRVLEQAEALVSEAKRWQVGESSESTVIEVRLGTARVYGSLDRLWEGRQILLQYSRLRAKHELAAWVRHLVLSCHSAAKREPLSATTLIIGRPDKGELGVRTVGFAALGPEESRKHLQQLVALYELGQRIPLRLFPEASRAFVETELRDASAEGERLALNKATEAFYQGGFASTEASDPYVQRVYEHGSPVSMVSPRSGDLLGLDGVALEKEASVDEISFPSFADIARTVFIPLLKCKLNEQGLAEAVEQHGATVGVPR